MQRALIIALISAPILAFCGCGGEKTPPDMPKLQPTSITIVQEGTPVEGASVQLQKKDDLAYKWFAGGVTDAQGVCVIRTLGKYNGAPEGDFQVVVYKTTRTESETRKNQPSPPQDPEGPKSGSKKSPLKKKSTKKLPPNTKKSS